MVDGISNPGGRLEQAWAAARAARANAGSSSADVLRDARALQEEALQLSRMSTDPRIAADGRGRGAGNDLAGGTPSAASGDVFTSTLARGATDIAAQVRAVDDLPAQVASGKVESIAELAAQVKSADLSFRFALEVRNKLIDAYREVMRMSV